MATTIGKMRYPMKLQSATRTTDAGGGSAESWSTVATIYADIKPINAEESYRQGVIQESVTHDVYVRFRAGLSTSNRLLYESRVFNIKGVLNIDERDRFMKLSCKEGVAT